MALYKVGIGLRYMEQFLNRHLKVVFSKCQHLLVLVLKILYSIIIAYIYCQNNSTSTILKTMTKGHDCYVLITWPTSGFWPQKTPGGIEVTKWVTGKWGFRSSILKVTSLIIKLSKIQVSFREEYLSPKIAASKLCMHKVPRNFLANPEMEVSFHCGFSGALTNFVGMKC